MVKDLLTAEYVSRVCEGEIIRGSDYPAHGIEFDSRKIKNGNIFAAIKGENTDGNNYVFSALEKGAGGVICERLPDGEIPGNGFVIKVTNTVRAMGKLANYYRMSFDINVIGVTGSVGKTTTRSFIRAVLETSFKTAGTDGNYNNEIGLPYSILNSPEDSEAGVFELGMGVKGDIDMLSSILRPTIGVITNIGTAHIEYLGSRENIRDAKMEIAPNIVKGGSLILNGDEPLLSGVKDAVYCGIKNKNCDYYAENIRYVSDGMMFDAKGRQNGLKDVFLPAFGEHIVLDALYAYAVGDICGISPETIKEGLSSYQPVGMRQKIERKDDICYIFDYYNASPESMKSSFDVAFNLSNEQNGRTVCVFGSVLEEGSLAESLHRSVGEYIAKGCDLLFTFGEDASYIADEAEKCGMSSSKVFVFKDIEKPDELTECVLNNIKKGDVILFKASNGIRLGRVADKVFEKNGNM